MYTSVLMTLCILLSVWMRNHTNSWEMYANRGQCVLAMIKKWILSMNGKEHAVSLQWLNHWQVGTMLAYVNIGKQLTGQRR